MNSTSFWRYEEDNGIVWLRINRPEKMNAFNNIVAQELYELLLQIQKSPELKVLILSSASNDAFSAGADMEWFASISGPEAELVSQGAHSTFGLLEQLSIPVIAAIKGFCFTAGLELVMCADMIYAADNAKFGQLECRFGITPGGGGTQRLTRLVGPMRAKELIFSGRVISAEEALRIGLINAIFPLEGFEDKINRIARHLLMNSTEAITECKSLIQAAVYHNEQGFNAEETVFGKRFASGEPRQRLKIAMKEQTRAKQKKP